METFIKKENCDNPLYEEEMDIPSEIGSNDEKDPLAFETDLKWKVEGVVKTEENIPEDDIVTYEFEDGGREENYETVKMMSVVSSDFVNESFEHENKITEGGEIEKTDSRISSQPLIVEREVADEFDSNCEISSLAASSQLSYADDRNGSGPSDLSDADKGVKCSYCPKIFKFHSYLQRHIRVHTNEKPFSCGVCQKSFAQSYNLKYHLVTHTNEKPFLCEVCKKSFAMKRNLKDHLLNHTSEKGFSCEVCKKSFAELSSLKSHLLTHTNVNFFLVKFVRNHLPCLALWNNIYVHIPKKTLFHVVFVKNHLPGLLL